MKRRKRSWWIYSRASWVDWTETRKSMTCSMIFISILSSSSEYMISRLIRIKTRSKQGAWRSQSHLSKKLRQRFPLEDWNPWRLGLGIWAMSLKLSSNSIRRVLSRGGMSMLLLSFTSQTWTYLENLLKRFPIRWSGWRTTIYRLWSSLKTFKDGLTISQQPKFKTLWLGNLQSKTTGSRWLKYKASWSTNLLRASKR